jgi:predicted kinase
MSSNLIDIHKKLVQAGETTLSFSEWKDLFESDQDVQEYTHAYLSNRGMADSDINVWGKSLFIDSSNSQSVRTEKLPWEKTADKLKAGREASENGEEIVKTQETFDYSKWNIPSEERKRLEEMDKNSEEYPYQNGQNFLANFKSLDRPNIHNPEDRIHFEKTWNPVDVDGYLVAQEVLKKPVIDPWTIEIPTRPSTSEVVETIYNIRDGVGYDHPKVLRNLAEKYFNLDGFVRERVEGKKSGIGEGAWIARKFDNMVQGLIGEPKEKYYKNSEEYDLENFFKDSDGGDEKYKHYTEYLKTGVFNTDWVPGGDVDQVISDVRNEEQQQFIERISDRVTFDFRTKEFGDHEDLLKDVKKITEHRDAFEILKGEPELIAEFAEAIRIDEENQKKIDAAGSIDLSYKINAMQTNQEIFNLSGKGSSAKEKFWKNYFDSRIETYKNDKEVFEEDAAAQQAVLNKYKPDYDRLNILIEALGVVNEYSSPDKIKEYVSISKELDSIISKYKKELSDKDINILNLDRTQRDLKSRSEILTKNYNLANDMLITSKALALDYNDWNRAALRMEMSINDIAGYAALGLKHTAKFSDRIVETGNLLLSGRKVGSNELGRIWKDKDDTPGFKVGGGNRALTDYWNNQHNASINYGESLQQHEQTQIPLTMDWSDVNMNNIIDFTGQVFANNIFSIGTALTYGGLIKAGMNVPKATAALSTTFFAVEAGGRLSRFELEQKNAPKAIEQLNNDLIKAVTEDERSNILKQIEYHKNALSASEIEKAFSSTLYGLGAAYAERLGTMRIMRNLMRGTPTNGRLSLANALKGTYSYGKGIGVEYTEEFFTQVFHNLVDNTVSGHNKSLVDGVDANFNANVIMSSMAIMAPSVSANVYNSIRSELLTQGEISKNRQRAKDLTILSVQLHNDKLSGGKLLEQDTRDYLISKVDAILREAALVDSYTFADIANLTNAEVKEIFSNNQKKRDKLNEIRNLGSQSSYERSGNNYIKEQKEKLTNEIYELNGKRDQLRDKPRGRRIEKIKETIKKKDQIKVDTEFYLGKFHGNMNIVKGLAGKTKTFGKINTESNDPFVDLTDLEKYLDKKVEKRVITKGQRDGYLKGFRKGNYASFVGNEIIVVEPNVILGINNAETALEKSMISYAPLHELQHIYDISSGLIVDNEVIESQAVVVQSIETELQSLYNQGKITEEDYTLIRNRINDYSIDKNGELRDKAALSKFGKRFKDLNEAQQDEMLKTYPKKVSVDLMELLTIAGELKNAGILKENSTDLLLSLKLMLNGLSNKYFKKGAMFFKLNSTSDVLGYIDSFQRSTRNQTLILGPEEEVGGAKFSRSTVNLDEGKGELHEKIDALTNNAKTKAEFQERTKENGRFSAFENVYTGILEGRFDRIFGKNIDLEIKEKQRENLADRLINYDPAKTPELSKWMYGGSGKAGNIRYSGLTALHKQWTEDQNKNKLTSIDTEEAKDVIDMTTSAPDAYMETSQSDVKDVKLRELKNFDIYLDNGFANGLAIAEVNGILSRFENSDISLEKAKSLMTEVTLKDIRAALSESIPKIAKDKASGITKPTPEYESWIRNEYDEIVQSLDIKTIRKYKFFEATVTGKKDYKNIDPLTSKVSNFVKPTQVNTTNKREYIRYFLEGKPNDLVERRTALIRRIAERKASIAVDNYIVENSNNINAVVLSAMSTLSTTANITKNEQTSFDSVQFSKVVRGFSDAQAVDFYKGIKTFANKINLANVADRAMVEAVVKEVWGGLYSDAIIKDLSKNFYKLLNRYATIDRNHTNLNTKPEQQLNEYLYSNLKAAELELNLAEFLQLKDSKGRLMKLSVLFDDTNRLKNQRSAILDFGKNLIKKYGEKQALMMMIHGSGMYSTSAKISRGNHTEINGDLTKIEGKTADFGSQRYQSFAGKKDWNVNVMQVLFPNISLTKSNKVSKYQNVTNEKGVVEKIDTTLLAESSKEGVKDRNFTARKAQAKLSELFVRDIAQYYKDRIEAKNPSLDKKDFAMLMMSMASNMQSPLKRAANLKYIYKDKKGKKYKGKLRYEHMIPTNYMVMKLADAFMGNKSNVDLDALFEEYTVAIIPVTMDNIMEEMGFVDVMPIGFAAGQSSRVRYYNMSTYGHPDLYAIESIDPKDSGQVYGEAVANLKITTFKKGNKFSKALGEATIISRTVNPAKGISVLDFDDTLATTKSGVRYTLPNPDGTPQPKKKVIFMAGGPGSGKSNVINQLGLKEQGFKVVNQDISLEWLMKNHGMPTDMREFTPEQASEFGKLSAQAREIALKKRIKYQGEGDGVVIDGTGASLNVMKKNIQDFKDKGYDVQMIFVETSQETALSRNKARKERSLRTGIVIKNYDSVQANKEAYKELFGERFAEVNTDNLKQGDVMPADVVNKVNDFTSGYIKGRLNAGEYATKGEELRQQGAEFDFSEFNQVVEGKTAPLFNKAMKLQEKFTSKDMFVLTARPAESNQAIFEFLQANGLKIPMENIIGLGSSASSDKALWIAGKVGEGYNDFYFADDILENVQAVSDMLEQFDVKSKVQQAKRDFVLGDPKVTKLLDEKSMNDVKDVDGLANPGVYSNVKFSKSHRAEYENTVAKNRPDLSSKEVTATIDKMFDYIDGLDVPNKRKYEQITTKWLATSNIKLPEDSYKIQQAVEIAELKKEDIFSYKNPNEIIEKYAGTIKVKPISPVGIKEFTRATGFNDPITTEYGIVEYEVEETREAQQKVRDIVNTHWGPNSNPWCITKIDKDGNLSEDAWRDWTSYGKGPKRIVFQNGKLLAMKANYEYWGKMNKHSEGPIIQVKEGKVTNTTELVVGDGGVVDPIIRETRTVSKDGKTVTTNIFENSQDGYTEGTVLIENRTKGVRTKETRFDPDGTKVSVQEFDKAGKPTTSYQFNPNGKVKSVNGHLQQQAMNDGDFVIDREDVIINLADNLVKEVGDILEKNYTEKDVETGVVTDYFYGRISLDGKVIEIGFESKSNLDIADVTKTVNGKTRLDIGKVIREVDPDVKGLPKTGVKFSKGISKEFNDIIEQSTGVGSEKVFSDAQAKIRGNKRRFDNIVPYSVQDLMGLLYNFVGRGKAGEQHMEFFKKALIDPFARAINELNQSKQSSASDYSNLTKAFPNVKKKLNKEIEGGDYTYDQAIRVYLWNKAGFEVPGLSKRDLNALDSIVKNDPDLQAFADTLGLISKKEEGYAKPGEYWLVENIASDLLSDGSIGDARSEFLAEWQQNADEMFSKENLNKIQAIYGNKFREALEDILYRMKHGTNRPTGSSRLTNNFMNWINNSTGAIMFFNMRSALLQTLSTTNYINWTDNNPLKAAMAFANQKQYWSDFSALFNSDFLKQRRSGNQRSINEAELTTAVANSDNKAKAAIAWLLQKGFLPTQIMDSFAISSGGATFYRNRINKYIKEGMSPEQAQEKAFLDFQEITEATQQSARPDMISQQQASPLGRLILSFQNTPMQYARIMNKAARDIVNGRGDQKSNISKIVYYGALQSIIFAALQSAIFAALGDDEEEEFDKKKQRIVDSMVDGWLAGLGVAGKAIGTIEKSIKEYLKQKERGFNSDHAQTIIQLLGFSPPIGSKVRKIYGAIQTERFNEGVSEKRGLTLDNPTWSSWGNVIEGFTNVPLGRMANKLLNIDNALDSQNEWWERAALLLGWNTWDLGIKDPDIEAVRGEIKEEKKIEQKRISQEKAIIKKEEKDKKLEKENADKEKVNLELQKKEREAGKKVICAAVSTKGDRCKKKIERGSTYCTIHDKVEQNESGKKSQCKKIKNDGKKCKVKTTNKSGYCYYHD